MNVLDGAELAGLAATLREPRLRPEYELLTAIAERPPGRLELLVALTARARVRRAPRAPAWLLALSEAVVAHARGERPSPSKRLSGADRGR